MGPMRHGVHVADRRVLLALEELRHLRRLVEHGAALLDVVPVEDLELVLAPHLARRFVLRVLVHLEHRRLVGDELEPHVLARRPPPRLHVLVANPVRSGSFSFFWHPWKSERARLEWWR